jgi:hypothetical protein
MHLIVKFMLYSSSMIKGCPNFKKFWFQNITNFGRLRKFSCLLCLIIWGCQYNLMLTHILCDVRADFDIEHCFQLDLHFDRKPRWKSKFSEKVCTIVLLFNMSFITYWGSYHPFHAMLICFFCISRMCVIAKHTNMTSMQWFNLIPYSRLY